MSATKRSYLLLLGLSLIAVPATAQTADSDDVLPIDGNPAQGLTLLQAMDQAEAHAYSVKIARAGSDEAESHAAVTRGQLGPKLAVEATDAWISKKVNALTGKVLPSYTLVPERIESAAAVITQPITGLGPLLLKLTADSLQAEAAAADLQFTVADARLAGADAYVRALKAWRIYGFAKASLSAIEKQRSDAAAMERQGKLSAVDVMRLDLALSEAKTQLLQARSTVDIAAIGLIETIGLPRETKTVILQAGQAPAPAASRPAPTLPLPPLAAAVNRAATSRPDVLSAGITPGAYKWVSSF